MKAAFAPYISFCEERLETYGIAHRLGLSNDVFAVPLSWSVAMRAGVDIDVLPLDQLHPVISGNKWFKLKYNVLHALERGCDRLASCGGAYSNHLHAVAWAGRALGLRTWGAVRGDELSVSSNATLQDLHAWGMELTFVSRADYRRFRAIHDVFLDDPRTWNIPEGGDNFWGLLGCVSLASLNPWSNYDEVHVACGTGCTFLGLRLGLSSAVTVVGHTAVGGNWQASAMREKLQHWSNGHSSGPWRMESDEGSRFRRPSDAMRGFMTSFAEETGVILDPVYTGPLFMRLASQLAQHVFPQHSRLLVIHSGGLQGGRCSPAGTPQND